MALLDGFDRFRGLGVTLLAGVSRKRFLGPDMTPEQRIEASLQAARDLSHRGARILRVHDVAQTRAFLQLL